MINTAFRLIILVPAALLFALLGVLSFGSADFGIRTSLIFALMASLPTALVIWTLADHRKRARAKSGMNHLPPISMLEIDR